MSAAPTSPSPAARVLVVDDRADSRKLLALRLRQDGHEVQEAADGETALALVQQATPDLVLLDVLMPGMDGLEVCRRLRALPALQAVPVVMVTSLDSTEDCVRGLQAGADDFIRKPFQPAELRARVRSLLRVKALFDLRDRQQAELAEWSRLLEQRVADGVQQVQRLSRLKRFFSPRLAARLLGEGADEALRSHRAEVTVLFADLRGYSAYAEHTPVDQVMGLLNAFHRAMGQLIFAAEGTLERFTGDGLMVFFNDPDPMPDHSARALHLALQMQQAATELARDWAPRGGPQGLAIGLARGVAALGAVGFESRLDYAAIGAVTNLAARLCAKAPAGEVWACPAVVAAGGAAFRCTGLQPLTLKGFAQPVEAFRVLGAG